MAATLSHPVYCMVSAGAVPHVNPLTLNPNPHSDHFRTNTAQPETNIRPTALKYSDAIECFERG